MIHVQDVEVRYGATQALRPTTLHLKSGEFVVLLGRSGAGKSTLLRTLNGLVVPSAGRVRVAGIGPLDAVAALRRQRRQTGMVFQHHQLIGRRTALANVLLGRLPFHPAWRTLAPLPAADRRIALDCLARVGLLDRALDRVDCLSGGQQQRVGIARALAQQPRLVLADEPVASLDPASAESVLAHLRDIARADGLTVVVSLHQVELARRFADRIVGIAGGTVVADLPAGALCDDAVSRIYATPAASTARRPVPAASGFPLSPAPALESAL